MDGNKDSTFVGTWVAASNLTATFDLAVHTLWKLVLNQDRTFSFSRTETISYPHSGSQGHSETKSVGTGEWIFDSSSNQVSFRTSTTIGSTLEYSPMILGDSEVKLLKVPRQPGVMFGVGFMGQHNCEVFQWQKE